MDKKARNENRDCGRYSHPVLGHKGVSCADLVVRGTPCRVGHGHLGFASGLDLGRLGRYTRIEPVAVFCRYPILSEKWGGLPTFVDLLFFFNYRARFFIQTRDLEMKGFRATTHERHHLSPGEEYFISHFRGEQLQLALLVSS